MSASDAMRGSKASAPALAGETRGEFGTALDKLLPRPELRRRFRVWRHTRPFWAGVFVILAGVTIISYPLGPWPAVMAIGAAALTGITIGLVLIIGGLFFWFAPHQRLFVSIVLMLCSVLSLVVSNLGGFFLGMIFGMVGSSMAFGWKQPEATAPSPRPRRSSTSGTAAVYLVVGALLASTIGTGAQPQTAHAAARSAQDSANRPDGRPALPTVGCGTTNVETSELNARDVRLYSEPLTVLDGCGNEIEAVDLYIAGADLVDYRLTSPSDAFAIHTDLRIANIELPTPEITINADLVQLLATQTGLPISDLLDVLPDVRGARTTITPELVRALRPALELVGETDSSGRKYFNLAGLDSAPASWRQPIIRGGDVRLTDGQLQIIGDPPPQGAD